MGQQERWPLGVLFAPTDEQLLEGYLKGKIAGGSAGEGLIAEVDIYSCDPWDLPRRLFKYPRGPLDEMYFFTRRHSAKGNGKRCARTAGCGVWHGNGKDNIVMAGDEASGGSVVAGHKTSFKFERKPGKIKTNWLMHEYRLGPGGGDDRVLCKIYERKGRARGVLDQEEDDGDRPQRQPKRRRVVTEEEPAPSPVSASCEPWSPDSPLLIGLEQPPVSASCVPWSPDSPLLIREDGEPDPAEKPQCSMADAADQSACGGNPMSPEDVFAALEDIDALACLPPLSPSPPLDADSWLDSVLALEEPPAIDPLPGLLPSPPLDAVALPSPSSSAPLTEDVVPIPHWPDFAHDWEAFEQIDRFLMLDQDVPSTVPSGLHYQF